MLQVKRLGQTFFAEVTGLDLARPLDDATFARVKPAHLEHGVLVFRDQRLTPGQHIAFSARFGPLQIHAMSHFNLEPGADGFDLEQVRRAQGGLGGRALRLRAEWLVRLEELDHWIDSALRSMAMSELFLT